MMMRMIVIKTDTRTCRMKKIQVSHLVVEAVEKEIGIDTEILMMRTGTEIEGGVDMMRMMITDLEGKEVGKEDVIIVLKEIRSVTFHQEVVKILIENHPLYLFHLLTQKKIQIVRNNKYKNQSLQEVSNIQNKRISSQCHIALHVKMSH